MNIDQPSFYGLPAKVHLKWSKSLTAMALLFLDGSDEDNQTRLMGSGED